MSEIRLRVREADGYLPPVCMCCGEPASATRDKKMQWYPLWVLVLIFGGLIPFAVVATILTKSARVQAPLCEKHQWHWINRQLLTWGSFFVLGSVGLATLIIALNLPNREQELLMPFVCASSCLFVAVWLVIVIACKYIAIRPKEITDSEITLAGVCDDFINAVEDEREERRARKQRKPRYDEDDEEEEEEPRPRKKRPASDAFEE